MNPFLTGLFPNPPDQSKDAQLDGIEKRLSLIEDKLNVLIRCMSNTSTHAYHTNETINRVEPKLDNLIREIAEMKRHMP
jgi:archaellum component FlaC